MPNIKNVDYEPLKGYWLADGDRIKCQAFRAQ